MGEVAVSVARRRACARMRRGSVFRIARIGGEGNVRIRHNLSMMAEAEGNSQSGKQLNIRPHRRPSEGAVLLERFSSFPSQRPRRLEMNHQVGIYCSSC